MDYKNLIIPAFLVCAGDVLASGQFIDEKTFENIKKVSFKVDEADFKIVGGDGSQTHISSASQGKPCQTIFEQRGDSLKITNDKKRGGCPCDYTITLPKEVILEGEFGKSNFVVQGMDSPTDFTVGQGKITFENTTASLKLALGQGILIYSPALSKMTQKLDVSGGNVNVECFLPSGSTTNKLKKPTFMGGLNSSVPISSSPEFDIQAQFGFGSLNVNYKQSNM